MDVALLIDLAVKGAVLVFAFIPIIRPRSSHFAGKAMGFRAVLYPGMTLLIPVVWLLAGRPEPYPVWADISFGLPFAIDAGANASREPGSSSAPFSRAVNLARLTRMYGHLPIRGSLGLRFRLERAVAALGRA